MTSRPSSSMSVRIFARLLASATQSVKPPIQLFGLNGTYASALYSASVKDLSVKQTNTELSKVAALVSSDKSVATVLENPTLSTQDRAFVAKVLSEKLALDKTTATFLSVLAENNRLVNLQDIAAQFARLNAAHDGIVEATVTSAKPLDSKIIRKLQAAISRLSLVGPSKTLLINNIVNPEILGGLIVEVGDKTADLSIFSKVARLNQAVSLAL